MTEPGTSMPGWPRYLTRQEAARYVGVSMDTFDQEVADGWWPLPRCRGAKRTRKTWDRLLLDRYADQDSQLHQVGLHQPVQIAEPEPELTPASPIRETAETAALRGVFNAAAKHRAKHRQPKAA